MSAAERRRKILDEIAASAKLARDGVQLYRRQQDAVGGDRSADRRRPTRVWREPVRKPWRNGRPCSRYPDVRLHCIGRLQSNKAAEAVKLFDVDSFG